MSVKTYIFTNEYGQLNFTASSEDSSTTTSQMPLESKEFINIFWVSMGDSGTSWREICNAYRDGARIIGISDDGQYQVSDITTGSNGSITFYRTVNDPESGTVTFYFWVYAASNGVGTWQTEYWITTNSNYAKTTSWYGTSSTSASTQAKSVTCSNYVLNTGNIISVYFSTANTYTSAKITLNVNSTGAKDIYYNGSVTSSSNQLTWAAGEQITFVYSGSYYYFLSKSKQTAPTSLSYSGGSGAISSSVSVGSSNTYLQYHNDNPGTTSSITLTASSIALSSTHVTVPTPTSDTDAANKKYVEDYVASLDATNVAY